MSDDLEVVYEGSFVRYLKKGSYEYVERNNCTGVVIILAVNKDDKVIFVEQYRPPVDKRVIEFPAGLVNDIDPSKQEPIEVAAIRELLEETGYKAESMKFLLAGPVSSGLTSDIVTMMQAVDIEKVADGGGDETESIIIHEVPVKDVQAWLDQKTKEGFLVEPKVYTGLYFLK